MLYDTDLRGYGQGLNMMMVHDGEEVKELDHTIAHFRPFSHGLVIW
jgi:hypothetical protein